MLGPVNRARFFTATGLYGVSVTDIVLGVRRWSKLAAFQASVLTARYP